MLSPLLALALVAPPQETAPEQDAARVLDATWSKFADAEALAHLGVVRMKGEVRALGSDFKGPFEELLHPDGLALQRIDFEDSDPTFFGLDGRASWEAWSDQAVAKFDWHAAADYRRFQLHRHGDGVPGPSGGWRALWSEAALGGQGDVDGRPCLRVVLTPRAASAHGLAEVAERRTPRPDVLWIDRERFLPVRYEQEMLRPLGGEVRLAESFSDWKEIEGVQFPMRRMLEVPGAGLEFDVESIEVTVRVKADAFEMPETLVDTVNESYEDAVGLPDPGLTVSTQPAQRAITVRGLAPVSELALQRGATFPRVTAYLEGRGIAAAGAPFARFLERRGDSVMFEVGVPVAPGTTIGADAPEGILLVDLPAGPAVQATHRGPYARRTETLRRLDLFMRRRGLEPAGPSLEITLAEGDEGPTALAIVMPVSN